MDLYRHCVLWQIQAVVEPQRGPLALTTKLDNVVLGAVSLQKSRDIPHGLISLQYIGWEIKI